METGTVRWTCHLTVASIKVTAMTQGKTVSLVGAQEVCWFSFYQRDEGTITIVQQLAVDRLQVHDAWILT